MHDVFHQKFKEIILFNSFQVVCCVNKKSGRGSSSTVRPLRNPEGNDGMEMAEDNEQRARDKKD